jgi:hypothetical protein
MALTIATFRTIFKYFLNSSIQQIADAIKQIAAIIITKLPIIVVIYKSFYYLRLSALFLLVSLYRIQKHTGGCLEELYPLHR